MPVRSPRHPGQVGDKRAYPGRDPEGAEDYRPLILDVSYRG